MAVFVLRLLLWIVVPILLVVLAIGPRRVRRWLGGLFGLSAGSQPAEVLDRVVREHLRHLTELKRVIDQAVATKADLTRSITECTRNAAGLEEEARLAVGRGDDAAARAALTKLNWERMAAQSFQHLLDQQVERIAQLDRRLHALELRLRQYEVGRSVLLAQLAEARTAEEQMALLNQFDPASAAAAWERTEGEVQTAARTARAVEEVLSDTADLPLADAPARVDPQTVETQLARLKAQVAPPGRS